MARRAALRLGAGPALAALLVLAGLGGFTEPPPGLAAAAEAHGCVPASVRALPYPNEGVFEVRCDSGHAVWFHRVDGVWTVRQIG